MHDIYSSGNYHLNIIPNVKYVLHCGQLLDWPTKISNIYTPYFCEINTVTSQLLCICPTSWLLTIVYCSAACNWCVQYRVQYKFTWIESRSIIVYANHSLYSKSKYIIQIRDVFITGGCHHILKI